MRIQFFKAETKAQREAIDLFLLRHNQRGAGSTKGYIAHYAAAGPPDGRPLVDRIVAAAKYCPMHTPQAAKFFAGDDWRHVYTLQRLAALRPPKNLLSRFLAWSLRQLAKNPKVWYVSTYADTGTIDPRTGRPHDGGIYRATNAIYCGRTAGGRVEAYMLNGQRHSLRKGPRTITLAEIPPEARIVRSAAKMRYCWAVGPYLVRRSRRKALQARFSAYQVQKFYQPRLLVQLRAIARAIEGITGHCKQF